MSRKRAGRRAIIDFPNSPWLLGAAMPLACVGSDEGNVMSILAINASPSAQSRTHAIAALALEQAGEGQLVDLGTLDAAGLLGRSDDAGVRAALDTLRDASIVVIATPIYRATYSGLLKVLFDLLDNAALAGKACVLAATGGSLHHFLSIDTGLRSLVASLGGWSVPTVVYATGDDFDDTGQPKAAVVDTIKQALDEARRVAGPID